MNNNIRILPPRQLNPHRYAQDAQRNPRTDAGLAKIVQRTIGIPTPVVLQQTVQANRENLGALAELPAPERLVTREDVLETFSGLLQRPEVQQLAQLRIDFAPVVTPIAVDLLNAFLDVQPILNAPRTVNDATYLDGLLAVARAVYAFVYSNDNPEALQLADVERLTIIVNSVHASTLFTILLQFRRNGRRVTIGYPDVQPR